MLIHNYMRQKVLSFLKQLNRRERFDTIHLHKSSRTQNASNAPNRDSNFLQRRQIDLLMGLRFVWRDWILGMRLWGGGGCGVCAWGLSGLGAGGVELGQPAVH